MNAPFEPLLHALTQAHDIDPEETAEWREALLALIGTQGPERARQILDELATVARQQRTGWQPDLNTPYMNTIAVEDQPDFPGAAELARRLGLSGGDLKAMLAELYGKATGVSIFSTGGNLGIALGPPLITALVTAFGLRGSLGLMIPGVITNLSASMSMPTG